ncbi:MAG: 8-amino-7-oxononanoate synthase [Candidatus Omnitrophica bacterium]|nr:8-amino-7-oxononanoate synthase [Candidatus Omnitrophota bacterium]
MGRIEKFLSEREERGLLRTLEPADSRHDGKIRFEDEEFIDFSSNDYLGLSGHPKVKNASKKAIDEFGASASASRLLSGDLSLCHRLEEATAEFKGKESSLVYNSGYQANVGIISALCKKGDAIFLDELSHASIIDGMLLSGARFFTFRHNDPGHLLSLLKKERPRFKEALIITETIFSMDGDRCPLREIIGLKESYDCRLLVDEAHATGIFGKNGSGVAEEEGLAEKVDMIMGTFSKALGSFGSYVATTGRIKDYLINSSRSFIYSTALPPSVIAANLAALGLIKEEPWRRSELLKNSDYLRGELSKSGFTVKGSSQIIPIILGESRAAADMSRCLKEKGYRALPIRPPTVAMGESRLRLSLTYYHKKEVLEKFVHDIQVCR